MSSSDRGRGDMPGVRPETLAPGKPAGAADNGDPYASWLDRMQRARARHAAITKNLYTWSNYKNWAERMRDSFGEEGNGKPDPAAPKSGGMPLKPPGVKR